MAAASKPDQGFMWIVSVAKFTFERLANTDRQTLLDQRLAAALTAAMRNRYDVPLVSPVTVQDVVALSGVVHVLLKSSTAAAV